MALPEELVEEVLLRFPPAEPASLFRAALVCKPWSRLISGRSFRRRFREFHRSPPMLGFITNLIDEDYEDVCRFNPVCTFRPPDANNNNLVGIAIDARHGRVLIGRSYYACDGSLVLVWDPTTDDCWMLPRSPHRDGFNANGAVLCATTGSGACDHLDCHGGHFIVVSVVNTRNNAELSLSVYSSEAGVWSEPTIILVTDGGFVLGQVPSALSGNTLCFSSENQRRALMYDVATHETHFVTLPQPHHCVTALVTMEDGGLGVARLDASATLSLWSLGVNPDGDMGTEWTQIRVIELDKLLPAKAHYIWPACLGFTLDVGVFFLGTDDGLFTFDLMSGEVRKVCEKACGGYGISRAFPYMSFYTPVPAQEQDLQGGATSDQSCCSQGQGGS